MTHYIKHLLNDPLGMFDSAVRDLFVFCAILALTGVFVGCYCLYLAIKGEKL